jgi:plasmid stability protein
MAQLIVRNIETVVKAKLKKRAHKNGRSMEEEVRAILRDATAKEETSAEGGLGTEIAKIFEHSGIDFDIPEIRGEFIKPPKF